MRVLGIDPSVQSTGYGIIDFIDDRYILLCSGAIKPSQRKDFYYKIYEIKTKIEDLICAYSPKEVAIENPFYAQNIRTALTLGQVRGAILVAVAAQGCALYEYSPREIKKAVTGYGQADKNQVQLMVKALLNIQDVTLSKDASDALATAFCHINSRIFLQRVEDAGKDKRNKK